MLRITVLDSRFSPLWDGAATCLVCFTNGQFRDGMNVEIREVNETTDGTLYKLTGRAISAIVTAVHEDVNAFQPGFGTLSLSICTRMSGMGT